MSRINVYEIDEFSGEKASLGWFDPDTAEKVEGSREWDGQNLADVHVGANRWQTLYRTKGGRYVIRQESAWTNEQTTHRFISAEDAKEWLLVNESDDVAEEWFGEVEDEKGPGRPEIGPTLKIAFEPEMIAAIDAARQAGESRSAAVRRLIAAALA